MKLTKEDWIRLASPVVLFVIGILLACSVINEVGSVFDKVAGVVLLILGAVYASLAFIRRKNVIDRLALLGLFLMGIGTALVVKEGLWQTLQQILGNGIGWTLFFFGVVGTVLSTIYLAMNKRVKFYAIELAIALVCGVIGALIVFPVGSEIIRGNPLWISIGVVFCVVSVVWLIFTIIWFNNQEKARRKAAAHR